MVILYCTRCRKKYPAAAKVWRCQCGGVLDLELKADFPLEMIKKRAPNMWRYREALPVNNDKNIVSFEEGFTPLLRTKFHRREVFIKQDHLLPSGSFKDRGASVLVSKIKELGVTRVVEDSSGNAGCAIAAYCAKAGIACDIYVPGHASGPKLAQITSYGARLHNVRGSRRDAAAAAVGAGEKKYYASHYWNPYFFHGTKTFAYEVCEQLGWQSPDAVVLPVGNGTLLLGSYIGFGELIRARIIRKMPRLIAVQSRDCAPLLHLWKGSAPSVPKSGRKKILAEGIAVRDPVRGGQIIAAVKHSRGEIVAVSDQEIQTALEHMGRQGFYIEPTAGATIAGVGRYLRFCRSNEIIVSIITGHGLKAC
jgi:threonine synthase